MNAISAASGAGTSVLIVGAGPAGLTAAIRLREQGIDVRVIDEQSAESKRTYPVLLHPRTLRILESLGVAAPLEWRGRAVTHLAVHTDGERRVILELPSAGQIAPGALTLPQDVLRRSLMHRLSTFGTQVEWQTRLVAFEQGPARVQARVVRRERLETNPPKLEGEWRETSAETVEAEFLIGADGCQSTVRRLLDIAWISHGAREIYLFYDAHDQRAGAEAQLSLDADGGNTVYPLQGELSRFTFQIGVGLPDAPSLGQLRHLLGSRLPWYTTGVSELEWSGSAEFHPALAARFGEGRAWLVGDAAHSTGPLGAQSLNVGIHEANDLALRMVDAVGRPGVPTFGFHYAEQRRIEWQRLFGQGPSLPAAPRSADWVKKNFARILPALPAAGDDLDDLLDQLQISIP